MNWWQRYGKYDLARFVIETLFLTMDDNTVLLRTNYEWNLVPADCKKGEW